MWVKDQEMSFVTPTGTGKAAPSTRSIYSLCHSSIYHWQFQSMLHFFVSMASSLLKSPATSAWADMIYSWHQLPRAHLTAHSMLPCKIALQNSRQVASVIPSTQTARNSSLAITACVCEDFDDPWPSALSAAELFSFTSPQFPPRRTPSSTSPHQTGA